MLKSKNCGGEGKFKFIKDFARNPRLKVTDVVYIKLQPVQPRQLYLFIIYERIQKSN